MRKRVVKKLKQLTPKAAVKTSPSKPAPAKLSKNDPDYYSKIGQISAQKRQLSSEVYAAMARRSHNKTSRPDGYHGGRPKQAKTDE